MEVDVLSDDPLVTPVLPAVKPILIPDAPEEQQLYQDFLMGPKPGLTEPEKEAERERYRKAGLLPGRPAEESATPEQLAEFSKHTGVSLERIPPGTSQKELIELESRPPIKPDVENVWDSILQPDDWKETQAAKQAAGERDATVEEIREANKLKDEIDPIFDLSAKDLADMAEKKENEFDLVSEMLERRPQWTPELQTKVSEAHRILNERRRILPTGKDIVESGLELPTTVADWAAATYLWAKKFKTGVIGESLETPLSSIWPGGSPAQTSEEKEQTRLREQQAAGTAMAASGAAVKSFGVDLPLDAIEKILGESPLKWTPEKSAKELANKISRNIEHKNILAGGGTDIPQFSPEVRAEMKARGLDIDPAESAKAEAGDPFSLMAIGPAFKGIGVVLKVPKVAFKAATRAGLGTATDAAKIAFATAELEAGLLGMGVDAAVIKTASGQLQADLVRAVERKAAARSVVGEVAVAAGEIIGPAARKIDQGLASVGKFIPSVQTVAGKSIQSVGVVADTFAKWAEKVAPATTRIATAGALIAGSTSGLGQVVAGFLAGGGGISKFVKPVMGTLGAIRKQAQNLGYTGKSIAAKTSAEIVETPIRGSAAAAIKGISQSVPRVVEGAVHGAALDLSLSALTTLTSDNHSALQLGAALGITSGLRSGFMRTVGEVRLGARDWGHDTPVPTSGVITPFESMSAAAYAAAPRGIQRRVNSLRQLLKGIDANADMFMADPTHIEQRQISTTKFDGTTYVRWKEINLDVEQALLALGETKQQAEFYASQNGWFDAKLKVPGKPGQTKRVIIVTDVDSAPHEAKHAFQNVNGELANQVLDRIVRSQFSDEMWDFLGRDYTQKLLQRRLRPDESWQDLVLAASGEGAAAAELKLKIHALEALQAKFGRLPTRAEEDALTRVFVSEGEITPAPTETLTPAERKQAADKYIAREISAETFDAVFKHFGPAMAEKGGLISFFARLVASTTDLLGGDSLRGRTSEVLDVPLKPEIVGAVTEQVRGRLAEVAGKKPVVTPIPKGMTSAAPPGTPQEEADKAKSVAENAPDQPTGPDAVGSDGTIIESQTAREVLGAAAEAMALRGSMMLDYRSAPGTPAGVIEVMLDRRGRRAQVEEGRGMSAEDKILWEKLFTPVKVAVTQAGEYQVQGIAQRVLGRNAYETAKFLAEVNPALSPFEIDIANKTFTEAGWRGLFDKIGVYAGNQAAGLTGRGTPLNIGRAREFGFYEPTGNRQKVGDLTDAEMNFINYLFGYPLPGAGKAVLARGGKAQFGEQLVSQATEPGRAQPLVEPRTFGSKEAEKLGFAGEQLLEVNPLRAQIEQAARDVGVKPPSPIEAWQNLNLRDIVRAQHAPELPSIADVGTITRAGFSPAKLGEKEFKDWLRPSIVTKKVYHGSTADFKEIDPGYDNLKASYAAGILFTSDPRVARKFGSLYEGFIQLKNPLDGDKTFTVDEISNIANTWEKLPDGGKEAASELRETLSLGYDNIIGEDIIRAARNFRDLGDPTTIHRAIEALGFDGIKHIASDSGGGILGGARETTTYGIFRPEQFRILKQTKSLPKPKEGSVKFSPKMEGTGYDSHRDLVDDVISGKFGEIFGFGYRSEARQNWLRDVANIADADNPLEALQLVAEEKASVKGNLPAKEIREMILDDIAKIGQVKDQIREARGYTTEDLEFARAKQTGSESQALVKFAPKPKWEDIEDAVERMKEDFESQDWMPENEYGELIRPSSKEYATAKEWVSHGLPTDDLISPAKEIADEIYSRTAVADDAGPVKFSPMPNNELAIRSAAIRDETTGRIYEAGIHAIAREDAESRGAVGPFTDGFVTNRKLPGNKIEFLDRDESFARAKKIKQIAEDQLQMPGGGLESNRFEEVRRFSPAAERKEIELIGPDGRKYRAMFDGYQETATGGHLAQITPLVDLPGSKVAGSTTYGPSLEKAGYKLPADLPAPEGPGEAQFAPRKRKEADPLKFIKGTYGSMSKAWILPSGKVEQLGAQWHHHWLSEHPEVAKRYKLDVPAFEGGDTEGVRESALKKGFARVNFDGNTLTIEAREKNWRDIRPIVEDMIEKNLDDIDKFRVNLLDDGVARLTKTYAKNLFDAESDRAKMDRVYETFSEEAQREIGRETRFSPKRDENDPITGAAVKNDETGEIFTGRIHPSIWSEIAQKQGSVDPALFTDGFVTESGEFLNREQAFAQALTSGQLKPGGLSRSARNLAQLEAREFEKKRQFSPPREEKTYYHVTTPEIAASVLKTGLKPRTVKRGRFAEDTDPSTYFFEDLATAEDALTNWLGDEMQGTKASVLAVKLNPADVIADTEIAGSFRVKTPVAAERIQHERDFDLGEAAFSPKREQFEDPETIRESLSSPGWAVISNTQEAVGKWNAPANIESAKALEADLQEKGYEYIPVKGTYKGVPQGVDYLVLGISTYDAQALGKKYKQESILTNKGLIYGDGSTTPAVPEKTLIGPEAEKQDFYSITPDGTAFSIGLDFDKPYKPVGEQQELFGKTASEAQDFSRRMRARIADKKERYPESAPLGYEKDAEGNFRINSKTGKPIPEKQDHNFLESGLAKESGKGLRGETREAAYVKAAGDDMAAEYTKAVRNPEVAAGAKWYSTLRTRLRNLFGDQSQLVCEVLAALSSRTPVGTNYKFGIDAINKFNAGDYDAQLAKYQEGLDRWDAGNISDYVQATGLTNPERRTFVSWWIDTHDLKPRQSNGKLFAANSKALLRALHGSWTGGKKTRQFSQNMSGADFGSTIDVWAARTLHRISNENRVARWRILAEHENAVQDADFDVAQKVFKYAADKVGIKPDALQGVLWFREKDLWEKRGWTRGAGAEKSDISSLIAETEKLPTGQYKMKSPQGELKFSPKGEWSEGRDAREGDDGLFYEFIMPGDTLPVGSIQEDVSGTWTALFKAGRKPESQTFAVEQEARDWIESQTKSPRGEFQPKGERGILRPGVYSVMTSYGTRKDIEFAGGTTRQLYRAYAGKVDEFGFKRMTFTGPRNTGDDEMVQPRPTKR